MSAAHTFVRTLCRPADGLGYPEPLVALLGPRGAGKSTALRALSGECGGTIMHALLDFADPVGQDPVAAVAFVAFELMRNWTNLPKDPTFHRLGLSLLALNEQLPDDPTAARARIEQLIHEYGQETREGRRASRVKKVVLDSAELAMSLTGIDATTTGQAVRTLARPAIGYLLQLPGRRALRAPGRWFGRQFEDATLANSLMALNRRKGNPLDHLMAALLADLAENATQRTIPVVKRECQTGRADRPHEHAWVLLADNADLDSGERFLTALVKARQRRLAVADGVEPAHDPLLVVAAVDRWRATWGNWWTEPWRPEPVSPVRERIPLLSAASVDQWARHIRSAGDAAHNPARAWYPVWLDPMDPGETATLAPAPGGWQPDEFDDFVRRLSTDLPIGVLDIAQWLTAHPPAGDDPPCPRSVFAAGDEPEKPLWEQELHALLPDDLLTRPLWRVMPDAVAVACYQATGSGELDQDTFPEAARTLRLLRANLWVSTFAARPSRLWSIGAGEAAEHPAVLHPWLARCLLAGLAAESGHAERRSGAWTWDSLFANLSDVDGSDLAHRLYYALACDRFDDVVGELVTRFTVDNHRDWVRLLDTVTGAPCRWPAVEPMAHSLARLAPDDEPGRTPLRATVANLVALLWLYRDPLTVPSPRWDAQIRANFDRLRGNYSARADTSALEEAAERFKN